MVGKGGVDNRGGRGDRTEKGAAPPTGIMAMVGDFRGNCVGESPTPRMAGGGPMGVGSSGWPRPSFLEEGGVASGDESVSLVSSLVWSAVV